MTTLTPRPVASSAAGWAPHRLTSGVTMTDQTDALYVHPRKYVVNLIPNSLGFYSQQFEISVEWRGGDDRWAVVRHDQCLNSDGVWDDAPRASEREEGWLNAHRFDLDTAFRLAKEAAPHVTVKGRTAAEVLARLIATGRIAQPAAGQDETPDAVELDQLRTENERMRHELEVMYGGAFDDLKSEPTDRAAVLLWAAEKLHAQGKHLTGQFNDSDILHEEGPSAAVATWKRAADLLRRLAAEDK